MGATVLKARLTAQLLAGKRARDPVTVVERLLAVQGQDQRGARLAVRARSDGFGVAATTTGICTAAFGGGTELNQAPMTGALDFG